jgi:hypothetical protein
VPATAFPSRASIGLASCGPKAFGADATGFVAEGNQRACRRLHDRGRAAHAHEWALARRPGDLLEELSVDPAPISAPFLRLLPGQRVADVDRAAGGGTVLSIARW